MIIGKENFINKDNYELNYRWWKKNINAWNDKLSYHACDSRSC